MTSVAHTASTGPAHPRTHLREYLAGAGATTALTSGALATFLALAAFVAFTGLPFGGSSGDASVYLDSGGSAPAAKAAAALRQAPEAVARGPEPGGGGAPSGIAGTTGGGPQPAASVAASASSGPGAPGITPTPPGVTPTAPHPAGPPPVFLLHA